MPKSKCQMSKHRWVERHQEFSIRHFLVFEIMNLTLVAVHLINLKLFHMEF